MFSLLRSKTTSKVTTNGQIFTLLDVSVKTEREHNLNELIQKQNQESYLKEASMNDKLSKTGTNTIELFNSDALEAAPLLAKTRSLAASITSQSANKLLDQKLKNVVCVETVKSGRLSNEQPKDLFKKNKPFFQSRVELKLSKDIFDKKIQKPMAPDHNNDHRLNPTEQNISNLKGNICGRDIQGFTSSSVSKDNGSTQSRLIPTFNNSHKQDLTNWHGVNKPTNRDRELIRNCANDFQQTTESNTGSSKMNRQQQKKYLEMRMSGWILDSNGKWIKDENVEFDSDEDEPA